MGILSGKRVLVTGATAGIGFETAKALGLLGADVLIVGRSAEKTQATLAELKRLTQATFEGFLADLSSLQDIARLGREVLAKYDTLHVLVNNAGGINMSREVTPDGYERTFATNHLGYFALTQALLPALRKAAPARIVNVASEAHRGTELKFDDLMAERSYSGFPVYGRSKLANILFTRELARRLDGSGVTANCLHPGVVDSQFIKRKSGFWKVAGQIGGLFMISSEAGAKTSVYLASSPEVQGVTGQYYDKCRTKKPSARAQDDEAAKRLWDESERLVAAKQA